MKHRIVLLSAMVAASAGLTGCATTYAGDPYYSSSSARQYDQRDVGAQAVSYGVVETVRPIALQRHSGPGAGASEGRQAGLVDLNDCPLSALWHLLSMGRPEPAKPPR